MTFEKALVAGKLRRWEHYLNNYRLPSWEDIPDLGLYMEQVILLLREYLDYLPPELKEEQFITAATINNYVRIKIMPEPIKRRYYRVHIAYLIVVLTLKHSLSMALIQQIIPMGLSEAEVEQLYTSYAEQHRSACLLFMDQVRSVAGPILDHADCAENAIQDPQNLVIQSAIVGGYARLMAEKLLLLKGKTVENGGSIALTGARHEPPEPSKE